MPTVEQKQAIALLRKEINIELNDSIYKLKQAQKLEKNKLKEQHQSQLDQLHLENRKKFLELKSQIIGTNDIE